MMGFYIANASRRGAAVVGVNGKAAPKLNATKRKKRAIDKANALELHYLGGIDKREARKREKLAKRAAKNAAKAGRI